MAGHGLVLIFGAFKDLFFFQTARVTLHILSACGRAAVLLMRI